MTVRTEPGRKNFKLRHLAAGTGVVVLAALLLGLSLRAHRPPSVLPFNGQVWRRANPNTGQGSRTRQAMPDSAVSLVLATRSYTDVIQALGQPDGGDLACRDTGGWSDLCKSPDDRLAFYHLGEIGDGESAVLVVSHSKGGKVLRCVVRI